MQAFKSLAFVSLSFVSVSGVLADEPVKAQPQQASPNQVILPQKQGESRRARLIHWHQDVPSKVIVQTPSSQPQNPASAAQPPAQQKPETAKLTPVANQPVVQDAPRRGLLSRLLGGRSRNSSPIVISQEQAPAPSSGVSEPLPNAK